MVQVHKSVNRIINVCFCDSDQFLCATHSHLKDEDRSMVDMLLVEIGKRTWHFVLKEEIMTGFDIRIQRIRFLGGCFLAYIVKWLHSVNVDEIWNGIKGFFFPCQVDFKM